MKYLLSLVLALSVSYLTVQSIFAEPEDETTYYETVQNTDTDGDGVVDTADRCPEVYGTAENSGCPKIEVVNTKKTIERMLSGEGKETFSTVSLALTPNQCILNQSKRYGISYIIPVCLMCSDTSPCTNTVTFTESVRTCDILFPTILSPDQSSIYARGGLYTVTD